MIRKLEIEGVTVFPNPECFSFVAGINLVVGGNDSGKSHLLKLSYALSHWACHHSARSLPEQWAEEQRLRRELIAVFGIQGLAALTARQRGQSRARIKASMQGEKAPLGSSDFALRFSAEEEEQGLQITRMPDRFLQENALFIVPREVLSIFPYYVQGVKRYPELFDGASRQLCLALDHPSLAQRPDGYLGEALGHIEDLLGGRLMRLHGRFYLQRPEQTPVELNLIAEGFKRLGTLALLIDNGQVHAGTSLYWDEPEMNLNSSYLPTLLRIMLCLCQAGVQLTISTHSLFLLRELSIQLREKEHHNLPRHYIGLQAPRNGYEPVLVTSASCLEDLHELDSLEAEIAQADRYLGMGSPIAEH